LPVAAATFSIRGSAGASGIRGEAWRLKRMRVHPDVQGAQAVYTKRGYIDSGRSRHGEFGLVLFEKRLTNDAGISGTR
jgi:hypothetical protein